MKLYGINLSGFKPRLWAIGIVILTGMFGLADAQSGAKTDPIAWAQSNFPSTGRPNSKLTSIKVGVNGESKKRLTEIVTARFGEPTSIVEGNPVWYLPTAASGQRRTDITAIYFHPDNGNLILDSRSSAERGEPLRLTKKKKVKISGRPARAKQKSAPPRKAVHSF